MHTAFLRSPIVLRAIATVAALVFVHAASATGLRAQGGGSGGVRISIPTAPRATSRGLPRLLDGGHPAGHVSERPGGDGWGWPSSDGWSMGWSADAVAHHGVRRSPRRVQPLIVFVSPYASVYATSSALANCGWTGAAASACAAASAGTEVDTVVRRAVRTKVIEVTPTARVASTTAMVTVDWLRDDVLRLRWTGGDSTVREVELVVADSARRVLASQRVHAAPYTAVFARDARTALVGVSVLRTDGTSTLSLAPLGAPPVRRD